MHNGPAGAGGWPLFILGMSMILSGLALIAPPPQATKPPSSPRLASRRVSGRDEDVANGDGRAGNSYADNYHDEADLDHDMPVPMPTPTHRRSSSKGIAMAIQQVVVADRRDPDGEGRSLVEAGPRHHRTASASARISEGVRGISEGASKGLDAQEVSLAIDDSLPVVEDGPSLRPSSVPNSSRVTAPSPAPAHPPATTDLHRQSSAGSPSPSARFSQASIADSEIGISIGAVNPASPGQASPRPVV